MKPAFRVFLILALVLTGSVTFALPASACTWSVVPSPNVGSDSNGLWDVSASSGRDAWAVGNTGGFDSKPVVLHWTRGSWEKTKIPTPKGADVSPPGTC